MHNSDDRSWMWRHCVVAVFVALLFLGIVLPNTGRVVIDNSTKPPTAHIVDRVRDSLIAIGMAVVPLALVIVGTFRRSEMAVPGWILLVVLVLIAMMK